MTVLTQPKANVDKNPAKIRDMFAAISGNYDFLNHFLSFGQDFWWRKKAANLSMVQAGDAVLDVCGGTGDLARAFQKRMKGEGRVLSTDFCIEMVLLGSRKLSAQNLQFGVADTLNLPFEDNRFDVCCVGFGIRNVCDLRRGIGQMARVLKSGGRVLILEFTQPKNRLFSALYRFYMKQVLPRLGNLISGSRHKAYSYLTQSVYEFEDPDRLKSLMESCGLKNVRYHLMSFGTVAIHIGEKA